MATLPRDLSLEDLGYIYKKAFLADPLISLDNQGEVSPMRAMVKRSNIVDSLRQSLPAKIENTNWWVNNFAGIQKGDLNSFGGVRREMMNSIGGALKDVPLGGYSTAELDWLRNARTNIATNPLGRETTLDTRYVPLRKGNVAEAPIGDSLRARTAQTAGTISADVAKDGLRNIWWFINAPQALASLASLQAMHGASKPYVQKVSTDSINKPLIGRTPLRLAATAPAVIAMSTGIGNIGRPEGYKAIIPSETDPRKTADPTGEFLSRYFLGRTGRLLPYSEFVKERPDVSPDEYGRYKAYQFNKKLDLNPLDGDINILGALRGTTDGIHGPELNFMGKTMPALTAILPTAAAVLGGGYGVKKAGSRLQRYGDLAKIKRLEANVEDVTREKYTNRRQKTKVSDQKIATAKKALLNAEIDNDIQVAQQALLYGTGAGAAAAITGQALESIRRDMGMED